MKKRKRSKKILLIVLAIIIAAILIFAYVQRNNIRAIIYAGMYNQEELRQKNEEVDNQLHSVVQKLPDINVQPLNAEDRQKLNSGELSEEDAIAIITGTTLPQQPQEPTPLPDEPAAGTENIPTTEKTEESLPEEEEIPKEDASEQGETVEIPAPEQITEPVPPQQEQVPTPETQDPGTQGEIAVQPQVPVEVEPIQEPEPVPEPATDPVDEPGARINVIVAQFYLLKAEYLNNIDNLIAQGQAERHAIPKPERTLSVKLDMAKKYAALGSILEAECDKRMNELLKELEAELKAIGQSTSVISEIRNLYNEEKAIKKAALIEAYYPKG